MDIQNILFLGITYVVSIGLHEYAHARASDKLGDPTPKLQGRLTVNPMAHIDVFGFVLIFLIGFGRGKPVQVNPAYYKNPLRDELLVALAGPATNFILAVMGILVMFFYTDLMFLPFVPLGDAIQQDIVLSFWYMFSWINIALGLFNLIPLWPLDGFRFVQYFFPKFVKKLTSYNYQRIMYIVFLLVVLGPGSGLISMYISNVGTYIFYIIYGLLTQIFW